MNLVESKTPAGFPLMFTAWVIAVVATAGSLFFSEVMHLPPCVLCWYQRIAMYPLSFIFLVGLFPLDRKALRFAWPLVISGLLISIYHNLLYYNVLSESMAPCKQGVSCTTVHIQWLGFITIPLLSLCAFMLIAAVMVLTQKKVFNEC